MLKLSPKALLPSIWKKGSKTIIHKNQFSSTAFSLQRISTIEIEKEDIKFSSGHFTIFSSTERERLHGHNYQVYASVKGKVNPENGLMIHDYNVLKSILRKICKTLDEKFLLAGRSKHLKIEHTEDYYTVHFPATPQRATTEKEEVVERNHFVFPKNDVMVLPLVNITGEELSFYILEQFKVEMKEHLHEVIEMGIKVSSSRGQSVSSVWKNENVGSKESSTSSTTLGETSKEKFTSPSNRLKESAALQQVAATPINHVSAQQSPSNKRLIITGGSSGIGKAVIELFLSKGYNVTNISRREAAVDAPQTLLQNIPFDLSQVQHIPQMLKRYNLISPKHQASKEEIVLLHAAAVHPGDSISTVSLETLQHALTLNVMAPAVLTKELLPAMNEGSSILYVGSTLSSKAVANRLSYVTSKHAMIGLMRSTVQDLFGKRIHSCCICPGFTNTEMLQQAISGNEPEFNNFIKSFVSFQRLIEPQEIANLIYQASQSPVLNGAVLHANLGQKET